MANHPPMTRGHKITLIIFLVVLIVPASLKFFEKLMLFIKAAQTDSEGAFALIPVANYLIVFLGMLCLLGWAIIHGMFRNIEEPKYTLLEKERRLDEQAGYKW